MPFTVKALIIIIIVLFMTDHAKQTTSWATKSKHGFVMNAHKNDCDLLYKLIVPEKLMPYKNPIANLGISP